MVESLHSEGFFHELVTLHEFDDLSCMEGLDLANLCSVDGPRPWHRVCKSNVRFCRWGTLHQGQGRSVVWDSVVEHAAKYHK